MRILILTLALIISGCEEQPASKDDDPEDDKSDIYGENDRLDATDPNVPEILAHAAQSVGVLVRRYDVQERGSGDYVLYTNNYRNGMSCPDEPFHDAKTVGFCTAWLAGPQTLITNSHCVSTQGICDNTAFVFDHQADTNLDALSRDDVYFCDRLLFEEYSECMVDYAVLRLDRPVVGRAPLSVNRESMARNVELALIGHPSGVPKQIAQGGKVIDDETTRYISDLDGIGGNSGSPELNAETGLVEGLHMCGSRIRFVDDEVDGVSCQRETQCESVDRNNQEGRCLGSIAMHVDGLYPVIGRWTELSEPSSIFVEANAQLERSYAFTNEEEIQSLYIELIIRPSEPIDFEALNENLDEYQDPITLEQLQDSLNIYMRRDDETHEERYVELWDEFHTGWYVEHVEVLDGGRLQIVGKIPDYEGESAAGQWHLTLDNSQDSYEISGDIDTRDIVVERFSVIFVTPSNYVELDGALKNEPETPEPQRDLLFFDDEANTQLPDTGSIERTIDVSSDRTVGEMVLDVEIIHEYRGNLSLTLITPQGVELLVVDYDDENDEYDIYETFAIEEMVGQSALGTWTLRTTDEWEDGDRGTVVRWALGFRFDEEPESPPEPEVVRFENNETVMIPDEGEMTSDIEVTNDRIATTLAAVVDIEHTCRGDLSLMLEHSPSGEVFILREADGDLSANLLNERFILEETNSWSAAGMWTLYVFDELSGEVGSLRSWAIEATY